MIDSPSALSSQETSLQETSLQETSLQETSDQDTASHETSLQETSDQETALNTVEPSTVFVRKRFRAAFGLGVSVVASTDWTALTWPTPHEPASDSGTGR